MAMVSRLQTVVWQLAVFYRTFSLIRLEPLGSWLHAMSRHPKLGEDSDGKYEAAALQDTALRFTVPSKNYEKGEY
jgi:hypothetical protein